MSSSAPTCFGTCFLVVSSHTAELQGMQLLQGKGILSQSREPVMGESITGHGCTWWVRVPWRLLCRLLSYWEGGSAGRERRVVGLFETSHWVVLWARKASSVFEHRRGEWKRAKVQRGKSSEGLLRGEQGWASWSQVWGSYWRQAVDWQEVWPSPVLHLTHTQCWFLCSQAHPWCWSPFVIVVSSLHLQKQKSSTRREF